MRLSILYRGPLSSCNYGCEYCPFAKHHETPAEHQIDEQALTRFANWVAQRPESDELGIFFTPWGEALPHKRYQEAFKKLSQLPQVRKVAIQTNLSCGLDWLSQCNLEKVALWCTYHPGEVTRDRFLEKCAELQRLQVRFSVGVVGLKQHLAEIEALRQQLSPDVYLWVNAYKREVDYYSDSEIAWLESIDHLFPINNQYHQSYGKECRAGSSVISVDGDGTVRRCHFIEAPISNIYSDDFERALQPSPCSAAKCGCHIGYVHMNSLGLYEVFGDGVLERIPKGYASN